MGFGNFRIFLSIVIFLLLNNLNLQAQQETQTSAFLYQQLDDFLQNPTPSGSLRLSKGIDSKKNKLNTKADLLAWVIVHCNLGYYNNQFGSIPVAILYYEKAWKTYYDNNLTNYDIIENCLQPLGNLYIKIGDLQKADTTIKNYLFLAEKTQNRSRVISGITNLSIAYNNQGNYPKAIQILNKGLALDALNINILTNLATNYLDSENYTQAEKIAKKVVAIDPDQINAYQILAAISLEQQDIKSAKAYIVKAKSILLKDNDTSARDIAKWQLAYIDILLSKSEFTDALENIKEIYASLLPKYSAKDELPSKEDLIPDKVLLKTLDTHAFIYKQIQKPLQAIKVYDLAFEVNSKLNALYPLQDTKIIQHSQNRNRTEAYIDLLFSLYRSTKNKEFVEQAFWAAEHSKAPFVSEALLSKKVLSQYKTDPLVVQKNELNTELTSYETRIIKEKLKGDTANISQIQKWTKTYDATSIDFKEVTLALQNKYPELIQSFKKQSLATLQKKLDKDKVVLIEYFYGNQNIYQFEIRSDTFEIKKIEHIEHFRKTIKHYIHYFDTASNITNNVSKFVKDATEVYAILKIPEETHKLLIIPDGLLNFIPFETLLTKETKSLRFQKMPFLLKSKEVSYEISASKYLGSIPNDSEEKTVLGIFPVFENTDMALPFSLTESNYIQQHFEGDFIEKEQATYEYFVQKAKQHDIIHLSTHAQSGSFLRPASIKLSDKDILVNQLYGMQLKADLVVLSACETGIGKIAKGEGPISIGRGFQYAGVENVLFSLWKVNDQTTSRLMGDFYKSLKNSGSKANSLHQAKLDYLDAKNISNPQKSPYYWGAFVYYGEIEQTQSLNYIWYGIGIVLFLLIVLLLRKFLQNKA